MNIQKSAIKDAIIAQLQQQLNDALLSANNARLAAIDEQSVAETQYDTLGIEASYLAHGQSERAAQLMQQINAYSALELRQFDLDDAIAMSALVSVGLANDKTNCQHYFIGPHAGGIKVTIRGKLITVITPKAPLGKHLIGLYLEDRVDWPEQTEHHRIITDIC
ncbi:hypothetical protein QWY77_11975 [Thalassotalea ponticola]|uniref:hypothetical protein n=1 Tax=Thalassotalea ponticola TaxID=1523392 RepID=UPI0025B4C543|nr:hypothetical protein [Thalassotalea ponticola]MDN3653460.1 hypothetical protein [Thalassotalea ponticola]